MEMKCDETLNRNRYADHAIFEFQMEKLFYYSSKKLYAS